MSHRRRRLGLVALAGASLSALVLGQELPFTHFTTEQQRVGLPSASVQAILQDREGFIWLGFFSSGLGRYDGHALELYGLADGLADVTVRELAQDADGYLWVGSDSGLVVSELALQDYAPGERVGFHARVGETALVRGRIRRYWLASDAGGHVWVGTAGQGLYRYRIGGEGFLEARVFPIEAADAVHLDAGLAVAVGADEVVWIALESGPVGVLEPGADAVVFFDPSRGPASPCSAIHAGPGGTVWLGGFDGRLWRLEEDEDQGRRFVLVPARLRETVSTILETEEGELWVGSLGDGLLRFDLESGVVTPVGRRQGLPSETVWDVLRDREANLWIAHNAGVSRLRANHRAFTHYTGYSRAGEAPFLPEPTAFAVLPPGPGDPLTWVGTGGGLAAISENGSVATLGTGSGLLSGSVYALTRDAAGRLWIGTPNGLHVLSFAAPLPSWPGESRVHDVVVFGRRARLAAFSTTTIYAVVPVALTRGGGGSETVESLWISGTGGLAAYAEDRWFFFRTAAGISGAGSTKTAPGPDGRLWVATKDRGLLRSREVLTLELLETRVEPGQGAYGREITTPLFAEAWDQRHGAPSNSVQNLLAIGDAVWVATPAGLFALTAAGTADVETVFHLHRGNGLGGDNLMGLAREPRSGSLWVTQGAGLAEVDPVRGEVLRTVSKQDGLLDDEAWVSYSLAVGLDGTVYLATPKGLSLYRPAFDVRNRLPPLLHLRQARFQEDVWTGYNEAVFTYAALSFANEQRVRFTTRLVGFDAQWSPETADVRIRYTNLPAWLFPKTYVFEVMATNDGGTWTSEPLRYPFRVRPAWWSSWWAWILVVAAFTLALRAYYSRRTQVLRRQNVLLEELVAERTAEAEEANRAKSAFLANMSHELRTPLNSIIGFSDILVTKLDGQTDPRYVRFLHNIQSSGQHLLTLINDILDLSKIEAGRMELYLEQISVPPVVENMLATLQPVAFPRGVDLRVEVPPDLPTVVLDAAKLRQILINLVSNAIKFSPDKGTVWTAVRALAAGDSPLARPTLLIEVRDQGIGIDPRDQQRVFEEFQQVDSGAARHYGGTGLGLALVRRFVEQQDGTIALESKLGEGSTFRVYLPLDASASARERLGERR